MTETDVGMKQDMRENGLVYVNNLMFVYYHIGTWPWATMTLSPSQLTKSLRERKTLALSPSASTKD